MDSIFIVELSIKWNPFLSKEIRGLFARIRYPLRGLPALDNTHIIRLNKIDGLDVTESDTLRITVTNIALENPPIGRIKIHGSEGTDADAGAAADAGIIVNGYATQFIILRDGFDRADIQTGRVLTLLACHGNINAFGLPLQHPDSAPGGIGNAIVRNRAHQLAQPAAGAFFMIDV